MVQALEGLDGVKKAEASHPGKHAVVVYNPASVKLEQMRNVLKGAGYFASPVGQDKLNNLKSPLKNNIEFQADDLVCFCFEHTRNDIEQDYRKNGKSVIMAQIASEKKFGGCECSNKNPKGR